MNILADENIDAAIVQWLREQGLDILYIAEVSPSLNDETILAQARDEKRTLLTSDLDFGEIVFRRRLITHGVVLLRYRARTQDDRLRILKAQWNEIQPRMQGTFTVATNSRIRIRPIPT